MNILNRLENEFNIKREFLQNTVNLLDEGNTIPFIARYRKELTGSLDDQVLRELSERLSYLRNLDETREKYRESIQNSGALTPEICSALENAETLAALEDIYRPFRPKRRTRATIAVEKGLQPLADLIFAQNIKTSAINIAADFINEEKGVFTAEDALSGGKDIIAEVISDNAKHRAYIRKIYQDKAYLSSVAADPEKQSVYEMYYEFRESVKKIAGHRVLAVNRGEKEEFLKVKIEAPDEDIINVLNSKLNLNNIFTREIIEEVLRDSYKRLIQPSIEREIRNELTEKSEEGAIKVFGANLKQLLLQPPVKNKTVIALDPGIRTGCKVAVLDGAGKPLDTAVIYPVSHGEKTLEQAKITLKKLIETYNADILAIGNGTASRETEAFAAEVIKQTTRKTYYAIVNEAGASVYSASKLGAEEFPNYDVTLRSAVSIGRRLQDPLAELVKIDPKSIGVGQYQHDMNQKKWSETLAGIVEACVNTVGVDLNTASPALLSYVAGISAAVAKNILTYREENGIFTDRKQLLKVKKLGP
ncbi:MAG: helix-hairpin-helix domain-containing protein, partial [Clostridiales bacterium]|nr:helix-hairpin-helix domain-containing protein [Clostridiales bacterium]